MRLNKKYTLKSEEQNYWELSMSLPHACTLHRVDPGTSSAVQQSLLSTAEL